MSYIPLNSVPIRFNSAADESRLSWDSRAIERLVPRMRGSEWTLSCWLIIWFDFAINEVDKNSIARECDNIRACMFVI